MTPPSASAAAAAPAIHPRRTTSPRRAPATRRPRRVSGPANPARTPARNPARGNGARDQARVWTGPLRAVGVAEAVATHRLLDRLIRGRVWIGVIAFALIGIVTMQLVLLKLNAGIGRSLVREALLQRENATLSAENSEDGAGEQVEAQATRDGMEPIPAGKLSFLSAHTASDVGKAAAALSAPVSTTSGEGSAQSTSSAGEVASAPSATSTGEANAQPALTTEAAATSSPPVASTETPSATTTETPPATSTETPASSASTATSTAGASEAATSTETPSAPTSTGGGTPGG